MSDTLLTVLFATVVVLDRARGVPAAATTFVRALIPLVRIVRALRSEVRGETTKRPEALEDRADSER
ncbi:hypothetical protein [Lentzea sp. NPDC004782]|uniref:hypothetical protein n=1 Tax=Lentzea sp. NPDC004782 TaxID=3154458 RepID=UPI0033B4B7EE